MKSIVFRISMWTLLCCILVPVISSAANSYLPDEYYRNTKKYAKNIYVVSSDTPLSVYALDKKNGARPLSTQILKGDTVYVFLNDKKISVDVGNESVSFIYWESAPGNRAFIKPELTKADMRSPEEVQRDIDKEQKKAEEKQALEELKNLIRGEESFTGSVDITLWIIFGLIVAVFLLTANVSSLMVKGASKSVVYFMTGVVCVLVLTMFALDYNLFYHGQIALSSWLKDGHKFAGLMFLLKFIIKSVSLGIIAVVQVLVLYRVLGLLGCLVPGGRVNYMFSNLAWLFSSIAMGVVVLVVPSKIYTVIYIFAGVLTLDFIIMLACNIRSLGVLLVSALIYVCGAFVLFFTLSVSLLAAFWAIVTCAVLACVFASGVQPEQTGYIVDRLGTKVGKVYEDGSAKLDDGTYLSSSDVKNL